jgi:hypothetical protein
MLLMQLSRLMSILIKNCVSSLSKPPKLFLQIMHFGIDSENQNSATLVSNHCFNHTKVFTFTLLLSEGRQGEACKILLLLLPHNKVSLTFSMTFHFHLLFRYAFYPLLSLSRRQPLKRRTPALQ